MVEKGDFPIYKGENFAMLEKSYLSPTGQKLSQLIILPDDPKKLVEIEKNLTADAVKKYRQEAQTNQVTLRLPKTKTESEHHLLDLLKNLGFPLDDLDPNVAGNTEISDIVHKTFVSTNEEGTEAAAATAIVTKECASQTNDFDVKHSYAYVIMDGDKMIFRGRVTDKEPLIVDK
jgi:serpin B